MLALSRFCNYDGGQLLDISILRSHTTVGDSNLKDLPRYESLVVQLSQLLGWFVTSMVSHRLDNCIRLGTGLHSGPRVSGSRHGTRNLPGHNWASALTPIVE